MKDHGLPVHDHDHDHDPPRARHRRVAELVFPVLAAVTTAIAPLVVRGRLPEPVAGHWDLRGVPDGSVPFAADLLLLFLLTVLIGFGPLAVVARNPMPRTMARLHVALTGVCAASFGGLRLMTLAANLDAPTWQQAGTLANTWLWVTLVALVVAGALGWWAAGDRPDRRPDTLPITDVEVRTGEAVIWSGSSTSRIGPIVVLAVLVPTALLTLVVHQPAARVSLIVTGVTLLLAASMLSRVRVTVGPAGLTARLGALGWPRAHVPIDEVAAVGVERVEPMTYGGWGWRVVPGATAIVVRRGPGLRIERTNGRALVVAVDGAAEAAGVLEAHRLAATAP